MHIHSVAPSVEKNLKKTLYCVQGDKQRYFIVYNHESFVNLLIQSNKAAPERLAPVQR